MKRTAGIPIVLALSVAVGAPAAAGADTRIQRVSMNGEILGVGLQARGTAAFPVPAGWRSQNRQALPRTAVLNVTPTAGCRVRVSISVRGAATSASTAAQVTRSIGPDVLRRGARPSGAWGLSVIDVDPNDPASATLYAIGSVHLTQRKYLQLRAFGVGSAGCPSSVLRTGALPSAFERIVKDGTVRAHVVHRR
jgi:hypothetical protein